MKFKTILINLDGILNEYDGKFTRHYIPPMKQGAERFLKIVSRDFNIVIFTQRNQVFTFSWLQSNRIESYIEAITNEEIFCCLHIDSRYFNLNYDDILKELEKFK